MLATFKLFGILVLILNLLLPIVILCLARRKALYFMPLMFLAIGGAFIKALSQAFEATDELEIHMEKAEPPSWFNNCIDESAQIDSSVIRANQDKL